MRCEDAEERVCAKTKRGEETGALCGTKRDRIYPAFKEVWDIRCHAMLMDGGESGASC